MPGAEFDARSKFISNKIDILKQATINSAKIYGVDQIKGTIKVGKVADLAVFNGKPDEDFDVFNHHCAFVFKNGELVARDGRVSTLTKDTVGILDADMRYSRYRSAGKATAEQKK